MWEAESDAMAEAIDRHYELLRAAIRPMAGCTRSSRARVTASWLRSPCLRRDRCPAGCAAALSSRTLADPSPLKVRIAVHTGETAPPGEHNYAGRPYSHRTDAGDCAWRPGVISSAARDLVSTTSTRRTLEISASPPEGPRPPRSASGSSPTRTSRRLSSSAFARRGAEQPAGHVVVVHRTLRRHRHRVGLLPTIA